LVFIGQNHQLGPENLLFFKVTIKKITLKDYIFLVFYESKKYFKETLFSLKMQYLNKEGQQASSKILKHPDEVITR
jgi:hypothetical protein